jgi:SOS-response transcriptional repressor LexA
MHHALFIYMLNLRYTDCMKRKLERVRLTNLEILISEAGSAAALARRADTNESYLSQIRRQLPTPKGTPRSLGNDLAGKLEKGMGKPDGWMDEIHQPPDMDSRTEKHRIQDELKRDGTATGIHSRHPLITWALAGQWEQLAEHFDPDDAEAWLPCPVPCSPRTFVLRAQGESMAPRFGSGDLIFVDPQVTPETDRFVVVQLAEGEEPILRQLGVEGGKRYLKALNSAWPNPIQAANADMKVCGVVVFKGEIL